MCSLRAMAEWGPVYRKGSLGVGGEKIQLSGGRLPTLLCLPAHGTETSQHPIVFPEHHLSVLAKMGFHESTQPFVLCLASSPEPDHHCLRLRTQEHNPQGPCRILSIRPGEEPVGLKMKGIWVPLQIVPEVREYPPKALSFSLSLGFLLYKMQKLDSNGDGHYVTCIPHSHCCQWQALLINHSSVLSPAVVKGSAISQSWQ